jgi:uncharacterized damage-inducible protein DinB
MDNRELIRLQLASVRSDLAETFPRLGDDLLDYAPGAGMRTVHGQFVEILATEVSVQIVIAGEPRRDYAEIEQPFLELRTILGLIQGTDATRAKTLELLDACTDENLNANVQVSESFASWLGTPREVPKSELFRHIARHESYHAGQLVSYLWARGDDPYGWD